jgi:small subunit ribosomal protein S29e
MTTKDYTKAFKQLNAKPTKKKVYVKNNSPKERTTGQNLKSCTHCGTHRGVIQSYGIKLCRRCFREEAKNLGFKKYD